MELCHVTAHVGDCCTQPALTCLPCCRAAAGSSGGDTGLLEALSYVNGRKAGLEAELIAKERSVKLLEAERSAGRRQVEELRAQLQVGGCGGGAPLRWNRVCGCARPAGGTGL